MRRVAVVLVVLGLVAGATAPTAAQGDADGLDGTVTFDVHVQSDGDARWNVSTAFRLEGDSDTAAFDDLATEFEAGTAPGFDAQVAERMAAAAEARTGRAMSVTGVERSATVVERDGNATGVLTLTFTWTNFSQTGNGSVTVGDAFGPWTLGADQRLRVHSPERFGLNDATPAPSALEDGVATWTGERSFAAGQPALTFTRSAAPNGDSGDDGVGAGFVAAVVGAVLLGGLVAYVVTRRERLFGDESDEQPAEPPSRPVDSDGNGGAPAESVDPELLSDEERIERLLEERGGRMKQADIVEETGWSNAKVSQLLSSMAEADRVEKLRIGRENLISLPDADVSDAE